ncbi:hypothetical protein WJX73_007065 [Symbiochloris irregularis]|uniref:Expansin-like EG45 domain-containing protein n=1 Tax=Symbiochloris irregularis TaxID=706552 RepID=A0AAW1P0X5_9CHLO
MFAQRQPSCGSFVPVVTTDIPRSRTAEMALSAYIVVAVLALSVVNTAAVPTSGSFTGTGYFSPAATSGWACEGRGSPAAGLPTVAINAAQFGMGAACGACIQVTGTGVGKGKTPMTGTYTVTVNNILTQGNLGDLDFPRAGDGEWGIKWSFVKCPGSAASSRRMLQA